MGAVKGGRLLILTALAVVLHTAAVAEQLRVLIGTKQEGPGRGLSLAYLDTETGALSSPQLVFETPQPVFHVSSASGDFVYVCHGLDAFEGRHEGFISAFAVDRHTDTLTLLNQQGIGGLGASHMNLDRTGRFLLEASYRSGHIAVFALESDGRLGKRTALVQHAGSSVHPDRQTSPHPHAIYTDPANRFALVPDLGLDQVVIYRFDETAGTLTAHASATLPPGTGPRHLAWHPDGRHAYATGELTNTAITFAWDQDTGQLTARQSVSTLPAGATGKNTAAEIAVHPGGRFAYASNRGAENSIAVYAVDPADRTLSLVEHEPSRGAWPRNFSMDATGRWMVVSNHESNSVVVFRIDEATGVLTPVGDPVAVRNPFGTRILPGGSRR